MVTTRRCLMVVVALLSLAFLTDLGAVTISGLLTADSYYLPLREIDVGTSREVIETKLIETHSSLLKRQRTIWFVVHGVALVFAIVALNACQDRPVDLSTKSM